MEEDEGTATTAERLEPLDVGDVVQIDISHFSVLITHSSLILLWTHNWDRSRIMLWLRGSGD
jgi:hypothetical protein